MVLEAVLMRAGVLWKELSWTPVIVWLLAINLVTAFMFWSDKQKARAGQWRVPEKVLLTLVFLGGSPGGLLASQLLRHKTSKGSFRIKFWGVIILQVVLVAGLYYYWYHWKHEPVEPATSITFPFTEPRP